jgi:hypothetical protein
MTFDVVLKRWFVKLDCINNKIKDIYCDMKFVNKMSREYLSLVEERESIINQIWKLKECYVSVPADQ